jgi:hypothetical protein
MRYLTTILITLLAGRFRPCPSKFFVTEARAKEGGTLEYAFEAGEQNSSSAVTKEKAG